MELLFKAVDEPQAGQEWKQRFLGTWPAYKAWFLSEGNQARPSYPTCLKALKQYMPELVPQYEMLVDLAGGGDLVARFLSLYCPAPVLSACSQVLWTEGPDAPALIRNYDYSAPLCEATVLRTRWLGTPVIAMSDCAWGVLDGMNDAGLAVSLAFGGRPRVGPGFGISLVLRYLLQCCKTVPEAAYVLRRVPVHMSYNVSAIDAASRTLTAFVAPDRPPLLSESLRVATNHQAEVEWEEHAEATATLERAEFLSSCLESPGETISSLTRRFLDPPIHLGTYERGWGTLYTAIYRPAKKSAEYRWRQPPVWAKSFAHFTEEERLVRYGDG